MKNGATITGKIVREGKPLQGVTVGVTTTDRTCGNFFNGLEAATDENGNFQILNVPPNREFDFYTCMQSLRGNGAVPGKIFTSADSDGVNNLGELAVQPAFKVAGRVILTDGKPVPAGTQLLLGRQKAWDSAQTLVSPDGSFEFEGVPAESVSLSVRIKGYKFARNNPSLDWLNGGILGRVNGDVTNLNLVMEPGQWQFNQENDRTDGADAYPIDKPLRGVTR